MGNNLFESNPTIKGPSIPLSSLEQKELVHPVKTIAPPKSASAPKPSLTRFFICLTLPVDVINHQKMIC